MPTEIINIIQSLDKFMYSYPFVLLPIAGGIISVLLIIGIIFFGIKTGIWAMFLGDFVVSWRKSVISKGKFVKQWKAIELQMEEGRGAGWRLALIGADEILDQVISAMGYKGKTMDERLEKIKPEFFPYVEDARKAHQVRIFLENDPHHEVSREVAEHTIDIYRRIFTELGAI